VNGSAASRSPAPADSGAELQDAFADVERHVQDGDADLGRLGFWRLVAQVKTDPALERHWAEVVGRIDRAAFEARVRWRVPVWGGNLVLVLVTAVGSFAVGLALGTDDEMVAGVALLVGGGVWAVAWHDLAHWLVGRVVGIRFLWYFIGGPFPPRPGLKIDYATYLRTDASARAWMHASGALATKLAPFAALAFWPASVGPAWAAWGLVALGFGMIAMDLLFSVRSSDWKRFRRERRVARTQASSA
jgi:hypothetical protein